MKSSDIKIGLEVAVKQHGYIHIRKAKVIGFGKEYKKFSSKEITLFEVEFDNPTYESQRFAKVTSREILDTWDHYASEIERNHKEAQDLYEKKAKEAVIRKERVSSLKDKLSVHGISIYDYHRDVVEISISDLEKLLSKIR